MACIAPWVPFFDTGPADEGVHFAFVDFLDMPAVGFQQSAAERSLSIVLTLPVFLPWLIVLRGWRRRRAGAATQPGLTRVATVAAGGWLALFALYSLSRLPPELAVWVYRGGLEEWDLFWRQAVRMLGLFGTIGIGAWAMIRLARTAGWPEDLDRVSCVCMVLYVVAVLPELVTDFIDALDPATTGRLLPGFALLLVTCLTCIAGLVMAFSARRSTPAVAERTVAP